MKWLWFDAVHLFKLSAPQKSHCFTLHFKPWPLNHLAYHIWSQLKYDASSIPYRGNSQYLSAPFPSPCSAALLRMHLLGTSAPSPQPHPLQGWVCSVLQQGGYEQEKHHSSDLPILSVEAPILLLRLYQFDFQVQVISKMLPAYSTMHYQNTSPSYHDMLPILVDFLVYPKHLSLDLYHMTSSSRSYIGWFWNGEWAGRFNWVLLQFLWLPLWYAFGSGSPKGQQEMTFSSCWSGEGGIGLLPRTGSCRERQSTWF